MRALLVLLSFATVAAGCLGNAEPADDVPDLRCGETGLRIDQDPMSGATHNANVSFRFVGQTSGILGTVWIIEGAPVEGAHATHQFSAPGTHGIELRAFTRDGCVAVVGHDVELSNHEPSATFSFSLVGDLMVLDGRGSTDPNGDALEYEWLVDGQTVTTGEQAATPIPAQGATVGLVVRDPYGGTDHAQRVYAP